MVLFVQRFVVNGEAINLHMQRFVPFVKCVVLFVKCVVLFVQRFVVNGEAINGFLSIVVEFLQVAYQIGVVPFEFGYLACENLHSDALPESDVTQPENLRGPVMGVGVERISAADRIGTPGVDIRLASGTHLDPLLETR